MRLQTLRVAAPCTVTFETAASMSRSSASGAPPPRAEIFVEAVQLRSARDRHDPRLLRQQPRDGDCAP